VPDATVFEFQTVRARLELLQSLGYSGNGVFDDGIKIVDEAVSARTRRHCECNGVHVFAGCALDSCTPPAGRFGSGDLAAINEKIVNAVESFGVNTGDLAIAGLCHLSDVMFAEACHARGAQVRLLIPRREQLPVLPCKGFVMFPDWENKAYKLIMSASHGIRTSISGDHRRACWTRNGMAAGSQIRSVWRKRQRDCTLYCLVTQAAALTHPLSIGRCAGQGAKSSGSDCSPRLQLPPALHDPPRRKLAGRSAKAVRWRRFGPVMLSGSCPVKSTGTAQLRQQA